MHTQIHTHIHTHAGRAGRRIHISTHTYMHTYTNTYIHTHMQDGQAVLADYTGYTFETGTKWSSTYGLPQARYIRAGPAPVRDVVS